MKINLINFIWKVVNTFYKVNESCWRKNAGSHCSANVIKCWLNNKVCTDDINDTPILGSCWFMRIDNMEAALLPDERTDLVSTNRLGHGWANQKLANQQAIFRAGCKDGCDLGYNWLHGSYSRFVETKAVRWIQWSKVLT